MLRTNKVVEPSKRTKSNSKSCSQSKNKFRKSQQLADEHFCRTPPGRIGVHVHGSEVHHRVKVWGSKNIVLGANSFVGANVHLRGDLGSKIVLGSRVRVEEDCLLRPGLGIATPVGGAAGGGPAHAYALTIGARTKIGRSSVLTGGAKIGEDVRVGEKTIIAARCVLNDGCEIMPNSVVVADSMVPPYTRWGGAPARQLAELRRNRSCRDTKMTKGQMRTNAQLEFTSEDDSRSSPTSSHVQVSPAVHAAGDFALGGTPTASDARPLAYLQALRGADEVGDEFRLTAFSRNRSANPVGRVAVAEAPAEAEPEARQHAAVGAGGRVTSSSGRKVVRRPDGGYELRGSPAVAQQQEQRRIKPQRVVAASRRDPLGLETATARSKEQQRRSSSESRGRGVGAAPAAPASSSTTMNRNHVLAPKQQSNAKPAPGAGRSKMGAPSIMGDRSRTEAKKRSGSAGGNVNDVFDGRLRADMIKMDKSVGEPMGVAEAADDWLQKDPTSSSNDGIMTGREAHQAEHDHDVHSPEDFPPNNDDKEQVRLALDDALSPVHGRKATLGGRENQNHQPAHHLLEGSLDVGLDAVSPIRLEHSPSLEFSDARGRPDGGESDREPYGEEVDETDLQLHNGRQSERDELQQHPIARATTRTRTPSSGRSTAALTATSVFVPVDPREEKRRTALRKSIPSVKRRRGSTNVAETGSLADLRRGTSGDEDDAVLLEEDEVEPLAALHETKPSHDGGVVTDSATATASAAALADEDNATPPAAAAANMTSTTDVLCDRAAAATSSSSTHHNKLGSDAGVLVTTAAPRSSPSCSTSVRDFRSSKRAAEHHFVVDDGDADVDSFADSEHWRTRKRARTESAHHHDEQGSAKDAAAFASICSSTATTSTAVAPQPLPATDPEVENVGGGAPAGGSQPMTAAERLAALRKRILKTNLNHDRRPGVEIITVTASRTSLDEVVDKSAVLEDRDQTTLGQEVQVHPLQGGRSTTTSKTATQQLSFKERLQNLRSGRTKAAPQMMSKEKEADVENVDRRRDNSVPTSGSAALAPASSQVTASSSAAPLTSEAPSSVFAPPSRRHRQLSLRTRPTANAKGKGAAVLQGHARTSVPRTGSSSSSMPDKQKEEEKKDKNTQARSTPGAATSSACGGFARSDALEHEGPDGPSAEASEPVPASSGNAAVQAASTLALQTRAASDVVQKRGGAPDEQPVAPNAVPAVLADQQIMKSLSPGHALRAKLREIDGLVDRVPTSGGVPNGSQHQRRQEERDNHQDEQVAGQGQLARLIAEAKRLGATGLQLQKAERRWRQLDEEEKKSQLFASTTAQKDGGEGERQFQAALAAARAAGVHPLTLQRATRERSRNVQERATAAERQEKHKALKQRHAELVAQLEDLTSGVALDKPLPSSQISFLLNQLRGLSASAPRSSAAPPAPAAGAPASARASRASGSRPASPRHLPPRTSSTGATAGGASASKQRTSLAESCEERGCFFRQRLENFTRMQAEVQELWVSTRDAVKLEAALSRAANDLNMDVSGDRARLEKLKRVLQTETEILEKMAHQASRGPAAGACGARPEGRQEDQDEATAQPPADDAALASLVREAIAAGCSPVVIHEAVVRSIRGLATVLDAIAAVVEYARGLASRAAEPSFFREKNLYASALLPAVTGLLEDRLAAVASSASPSTTSTSSTRTSSTSIQRAHQERRRFHNEMQDLKGAVRVYARVRPASQAEQRAAQRDGNIQTQERPLMSPCPSSGTIAVRRAGSGPGETFEFDAVFGPGSSQADVFAEFADLVQSALDGFNVCIFTYGQTGAGKTYTLLGGGKSCSVGSGDDGGQGNDGVFQVDEQDLLRAADARRGPPTTSSRPLPVGVAETGSFVGTSGKVLPSAKNANEPCSWSSDVPPPAVKSKVSRVAMDAAAGIAPRTIDHIFQLLETNPRYATREVFVTMCELHNTRLRDLLADPGPAGGATATTAHQPAGGGSRCSSPGGGNNSSRGEIAGSSFGAHAHLAGGTTTATTSAPSAAASRGTSTTASHQQGAALLQRSASEVGLHAHLHGVRPQDNLQVKFSPRSGQVRIPGATELRVTSRQELRAVLELGIRLRKTAATTANADSSRSHLVLSVHFRDREAADHFGGSKVTFCDLAGSERLKKSGATGTHLKEAVEINKSLSALGDVLQAIVTSQNLAGRDLHAPAGAGADGPPGAGGGPAGAQTSGATGTLPHQHHAPASSTTSNHFGVPIPYRNHKLTQLMQDSLGGNAKTCMFVNLSPCTAALDESLMSLRFAARTRQVKQKR